MGVHSVPGSGNLIQGIGPGQPQERDIVKYLDLKKINERIRYDIIGRLEDMLDDGCYIGGKWNQRFCRNFARFCGTKHVVGVGNGLDALRIILQASGFGKKDEIIVPANTS